MEPLQVIKYPLATEKSIRLMEAENKLIFVVDNKANRADVKKAVEEVFNVKVDKVNVYVMKGLKRAYVKFSKKTPAIDIATNLGLM